MDLDPLRGRPGARLRAWVRLAAAAAIALLAIPRSASAQAGTKAALRWENPGNETVGNVTLSPVDSRLLPDGTLVLALASWQHLSVARFPPGSQIASVVPIPLPTGQDRVAIDACGNVFVAAAQTFSEYPDAYESNVWLMKFDSVNGQPLWNSPFVWGDASSYDGAVPVALLTDPAGDAVLTALTLAGYLSFKLEGLDGGLQWTSALIPNGPIQQVYSVVDDEGDLFLSAKFDTSPGAQVRSWALDGGTGALAWGPVGLDAFDPQGMAVDPDGNVVIVADEGSDVALFRLFAGSGTLDWGPARLANARARALAVGAAGTIFVGGFRQAAGQSRLFVAAFEPESGDALWSPVEFDAPNFAPPSLAAASNGDVVLTGIFQDGASGYRLGTCRIGRDGMPTWGLEYRSGVTSISPLSILEPGGTLVELFHSTSEFNGPPSIARRNAATGQTTQSPQPYTGLWNEVSRFSRAVVLADQNLTIATTGFTVVGTETTVRKIARGTGQDLWSTTFPNGSPRLAADGSGDLLSTAGFEMRKLDGENGAVIWGPVTTSEPATLPRFAVFDPSGDVLVLSMLNVSPFTAFLEKRSGASGALLWGPVGYAAIGNHRPAGLAVDTSGDAVVSLLHLEVPFEDWVTYKHSGHSGSILWGPVAYDRAGRSDRPIAIETLPGGDVVVTGDSSDDSRQDIAVVRYAGSDGALVWGPVFPDVPQGIHSGVADMIVDVLGDVFVAGFAWDSQDFNSVDLLAVKLSGANGTLAWGPTLHDTGVNDYGMSIALLPSGDPVVLGFRDRFYTPGYKGLLLYSWDSDTGALRWGPVRHGSGLDEYPEWIGVGGNTIFVAADIYRNGSRPSGWWAPSTLLLAYDESLGISSAAGDRLATCGEAFTEPLEAANVTGTATFSLASGNLPNGLTLSAAGLLAGAPVEIGRFPITVQVQDSSLATATRDLTIVVREEEIVGIVATPVNDCAWMLSAPGGWTSYFWEPGGQTTPTITISPAYDTVYGVTVGDGSGCTACGSILIRATRLIDPDCDAPLLFAIDPTSGPASGGTELTLSGAGFEAGSQARIGGIEVPTVFQTPGTIVATTPALDPGALNSVLVVNPDLATALLFEGFFADFFDVPQAHLFHNFVEDLVRAQVTAGCGGGNYCPDLLVTRAQMAVFLLVSKNGPGYTPPQATGTIFNDVGQFDFAAAFIEALAAALVTGGCGGGNYCPNAVVTRDTMAILLLRTLEGPNYSPPSCTTPTFSDVPCSSPFARWIEELVDRGITAGCGGGLYCPLLAVSRGQMAVFLTVTFGLP